MRHYLIATLLAACALAQVHDPRNIVTGNIIPDEGYADQPYIVKTDDGAWLSVITTGPGKEGASGQHVVTRRSTDRGGTWSAPVDVEPSSGPEASYAVLLKAPYGRVYVFYNHNTDNVRRVIADNPPYADGFARRVDSLGHFVFKYSDDHGRSWSTERRDIPLRDFDIDRRNPYGGKLKFFWNVGKAFTHRGAGYVPLHKVGGIGDGFFTSSEGVLLRSSNILTECDAAKLQWETLPEGDIGLRTPARGGPVAEEQSFSELSDGSLFAVYRTIDGHPASSYSRDAGRAWAPPEYLRFDDGRKVKHPRAANFAWRCSNGKFLYWFHNHGGRFIAEHPRRRTQGYEDRNPVWLAGGIEADSPRGKIIRWSQPEIALYDDDPLVRMSYPDLVEDGGKYYLTETQKDIGRVHEVDPELIEGLWSQFDAKAVATRGLLLDVAAPIPAAVRAPELPAFLRRSSRMDHGREDLRAGFTIEAWVRLATLDAGQILVDNRAEGGRGFVVRTTAERAVELVLDDGTTQNCWSSDPGTLKAGEPQHIVAIVDGGPKIIAFVIDGKLCDGGDARQFGWGRFSPHLKSAGDGSELRINSSLLRLRVYNRYLRISEAIASHRAGY
jgi:hypothetical protein